jgi:hypothetical protein
LRDTLKLPAASRCTSSCHSRGACPREGGERGIHARLRRATLRRGRETQLWGGHREWNRWPPQTPSIRLRRPAPLLGFETSDLEFGEHSPRTPGGTDVRLDKDGTRGLWCENTQPRRRFLSSNAGHRPPSRQFRVSACSGPSAWLRTRWWNRAAQDGSSCHPLTSRTPGP